MTKMKLKNRFIPLFAAIMILLPVLGISILYTNSPKVTEQEELEVIEEPIEKTVPVINSDTIIQKPYNDPEVKIGRTYYDYKGDENSQVNSITTHENTYLQNTGIDYINENVFDVISILDGTVITVKEDETIGKTIEIKHDNGIISTYQSLSEILVKKGDIVTQGQTIGKSGSNELEKDLGNHLHFEIYDNGQAQNPENYYNKIVKEEKKN